MTATALRDRVVRVVGIDLRVLAVFRVALAGVILLDLVSRAANLGAHYTDAGVLPTAFLEIGLRPSIGAWIATHWPGTLSAQAWFFAIYAAAAVALGLGYRTRTATAICWVATLALQARNPLVLHRADTLLKMLLFWSLFLPLGARLALDARGRAPREDEPDAVASPASIALLLQPCVMYWLAVASRSSAEWWNEASALWYASHADVIVRPAGAWLGSLPPGLLAGLTRAVVVLELALPLALWSPWATARVRLVALGAFAAMLTGFGVAFDIGYFPLTAAIALIPFLPGVVLTRGAAEVLERERPRIERARAALAVPAAVALAFTLALNLDTHLRGFPFPAFLSRAGVFVGLEQRWDIFAPAPPKVDEWFVAVGRLPDGAEIDLVRGAGEPSWTKPASFGETFSDYRWRRFWFSLRELAPLREATLRWAARRWDREHPDTPVLSYRLELLSEVSPAPGLRAAAAIERRVVWPPSAP